ncbi:MAG: ribose 5-phosphate isomerase B [Alphaproteobacteria bacterium]|jgi:ribose 5-phosphate isomerase B|nr:ribose 5-phosphate isomerase B [Alphaproteobacteria bacterium]MBT4017857.1 ribose 5-phosphate isomerase B [Alphaproteobacteria bacterium]MBT4965208.1 ribose 5-phosphate isomerase B [Alphaproteobacteria bacterium]MBT5159693.1 ribose 5-phosphate isomerase B [Alphaproteobacteria bacterium]MBT5917457.1 ribose 5-phosphate isomerase B [Alphaproteobacteria bacterium]
MSREIVAIAADHGGYELKEMLKADLEGLGFDVLDLGTNSNDSVDYPDFGHALGQAIEDNKARYGVAICGSGIGISIAANRHANVRAALCHDGLTAKLARQHNNANVLALGARIIGIETARDAVSAFFTTDFEGGRHERRVDKIELS